MTQSSQARDPIQETIIPSDKRLTSSGIHALQDIRAEGSRPGVTEETSRRQRMSLLVIGDGFVATHPLPAQGSLDIGRGDDAEIVIDVSSISRHHARITVGETITIEDLGSSNGTIARDQRLEVGTPVEISLGEVVDLGTVMIIVQARSTASRPRRIWTHGYFEARLEEECARVSRTGGRFALFRKTDASP